MAKRLDIEDVIPESEELCDTRKQLFWNRLMLFGVWILTGLVSAAFWFGVLYGFGFFHTQPATEEALLKDIAAKRCQLQAGLQTKDCPR